MASSGSGEQIPPGKPMSIEQKLLDKGAEMMQSFKPVNKMSQHLCTFAIYSHDMTRQIETHHFVTRLNQDFLQCAVYDSDDSSARLIGLLIHPRIPEMVAKPELENLAKSYGKFWCTWQVDKGDNLPVGAPALMVSPQAVNLGMISPTLVAKRDAKYNIQTKAIMDSRVEIAEPEMINPKADYWKQHGKGFAIDVEQIN